MNPNATARQDDEEIFAQAIEIESLDARKVYLDNTCGSDGELRRRIDRLLDAHDRGDSLFDSPDPPLESIFSQPARPDRFGEFEIIREIGRGGMGIVYEAQQTSLNRRVALKVLSVGLGFSKKAIARFQREAQAAARLHHTNIVPIYSTGIQDQIPYYAMELVHGPSLDQVLEQLRGKTLTSGQGDSWDSNGSSVDSANDESPGAGVKSANDIDDSAGYKPAPRDVQTPSHTSTVVDLKDDTLPSTSSFGSGADYFDRVARAMADVADALEHAHREGVIHRDIKPSNLLLSPEGRVSINDFGLARIIEEPSVTVTGELLGSPRYMSPEQVSPDDSTLDHRTDIFSLGVTLYELITLRPAFDGSQRDQILTQIMHKEPKAPRRLNPKIPADLETICQKAIEKDPARRYPTAQAMAEDLRRFVNHYAITAKRIGPVGRALRWCRRNRSLAGMTAMLAVCLIVGTSLVQWQRISQSSAAEARYQATVREIETLREDHPWDATIRIHSAMREFPDRREEFSGLPNKIGRSITIDSDPPGAEIVVRPAGDISNSWLALGKTPVTTRLPLDGFHVRASMEGRDDLISLQHTHDGNPDTWLLLLPTRKGMVRVPKSWYEGWIDACRITWLMNRQMPPVAEFQIDRHEVTNAEFQKFVNEGGYERPEYWSDTLGESWRETVDKFRDSTKQFGPKDWVDGEYPSGLRDHPVVGVSWYEAMAYANWAGEKLPTLFHWLRGADYNGWYDSPDYFHRSNIGNQFLTPRNTQDGLLSVCKYGVMETEGNVKEWCLNEEHDGAFYAMGGGWRDEEGTMFDPVAFKAIERRDDVGFRCAIYSERPDLAGPVPVQWRPIPIERRPIDQYRELFVYDRSTPWNASRPEWVRFEDLQAQRIQFDAVYGEGERITCYIVFPDRARFAPPYQVLLGSTPIKIGNDGVPRLVADIFQHYRPMLNAGRALVFPAYWGNSFERSGGEFNTWFPDPNNLAAFTEGMVKVTKDLSRTTDFIYEYQSLVGDNLLDRDKLGFVACGCMNTVCCLVADKLVTGQNRFQAVFFAEGGIANCIQPPEVDQLTYLPHLDIPSVILTTRRYLPRPYERSQKPMYELLPLVHEESKRLWVIPNYDWGLPPEHIDREVNWWLDKCFKGKPALVP